jgi:type I restriction enzyme S subunit
MRRGIPEPGDVVLTTEAPLGEVAQLDGRRFALAQRLITLRGKHGLLDNTFLKYLLLSKPLQAELLARATGTTVIGIKQSELRKVPLTFPDIDEQLAIAGILRALDDKIEVNYHVNRTLETMASTLFKSWLVDFDPVRAKANGCQPAGMDADTVALFPDHFEDSELGKIPKGWHVRPLSEVIAVNPPRSLRKGVVAPYLDMGSMPTQSARALDWYEREFNSGTRFLNGDTLVARITPCLENGKTAFVDFLADGQIGWGSTEYIVLCPREPLPPEFAYFLARTDDFRNHAIVNMTGTSGRQRVPPECFDRYPVVVPPESIARRFGEFASTVIAVMKQRDEESRTLAELRDTLLPKLISGELRVPA